MSATYELMNVLTKISWGVGAVVLVSAIISTCSRCAADWLMMRCARLVLISMAFLPCLSAQPAKAATVQVPQTSDPWKSGEVKVSIAQPQDNVELSQPPGEDEKVIEPQQSSVKDNTTYVVKPGDHFWSIARQHDPDDVVSTWKQLLEWNKDRIRSGNVNLIYPGEEIIMPTNP